jgi:hypothetical protein
VDSLLETEGFSVCAEVCGGGAREGCELLLDKVAGTASAEGADGGT